MDGKVAILLTVHNRREKTLECLRACYRQIDDMKADGNYEFTVYLVDDGSTDGTSEAVMEAFPQTRLLKGDGNLFWNQGMLYAWKEAAKDSPDFYLWINDDTMPEEGAFDSLLENSRFFRNKAIVVGTSVNALGEYSYGGRTKSNKIVEPDPKIPLPCYTFNGNLVLVPKYVYDILGPLDHGYSHSFGDYDYGVRAYRAKIARVVAPEVLARCDRNPGIDKWRDGAYTLKQRFAYLRSPKGRPPREQFRYDLRSMGFFRAIGHQISIFIKVLFPFASSVRKTTAM